MSGRSMEEKPKLIGVVIFNFSPGGLTGLKWASDYMKLPPNHELCIILVKLDEKQVEPCIGSALVRDDMEAIFRDEINDPVRWKEWFDVVQHYTQKIVENKKGDRVQGRICTGRTVEEALKCAITKLPDDDLDLHTLVLGWAGADAGSQTTPQPNPMNLSGVKNIILAEIDSAERNETPSFVSALVAPVPAPDAKEETPPQQPDAKEETPTQQLPAKEGAERTPGKDNPGPGDAST